MSSAGALTNGQTIYGAFIATGTQDSYTFTASAGESFAVAVQETSGVNFSARLNVYDPNGDPLNAGSGYDSWFAEAPIGGTYTVIVFDSANDASGTYNLSFMLAPGASERGVLTGGKTEAGSLDPGDFDTYGFDLAVDDSFAVAVQETSGTNFSARLRVYGPTGQPLNTGNGYDSWFARATTAGRYTVVLYDQDAEDAGTYNFSYAVAPGPSELGALVNGATYQGHSVPGDIDSLSFHVGVGESFALATQETGGDGFNARLRVYGPAGQPLNTGTGYDSWFATAAVGGTHTVIVFDSDIEDDGDYNLTYVRAPGANANGVLTKGAVVADSIVPAGIASYTFGANAGEDYSVAVTTTSGTDFSARLRVYDPTGAPVNTGSGYTSWSGTAAVDGIYTVIVFDFDNEDAGGFQISFDITTEVLSYAALGDSYSSGEGVWPYFDPTDTLYSGRHQSTRAYATKLRVPGTSTPIADRADAQFDFLACTGATTENVVALGEDCRGYPTQLAPQNNVDASRDLVTISIGGNDAQFARILLFCLAHNHCNDLQPFSPHSDVELGELFPLLALYTGWEQLATFSEIKSKTPNAPTMVFGYPILMGGAECDAVKIPFTSDAKLSVAEQQWMREANAFLNQVTQQAAALAGVHFVSVAEEFDGHGVCGPLDDWINGVVPIDFYASFHPTARGQQGYADAVNAYLESIKTGWPAGYFPTGLPRNPAPTVLFPEIDFGSGAPATAPSFGELSVELASAPSGCEDAQGVIVPGQEAALAGAGFAADELVTLQLVIDDQAWALGSAFADSNGDLSTTATIPGDVPIGSSGAMQALGAGPGGGGLLLIDGVNVEASVSIDGDGDGVPDGCDNCPGTSNGDQADQDLDGQGDACDLCAAEFINDEDGDGLCASVDTCPLDPLNDEDGDGFCALVDNCPITANASQVDTDGDGTGDACEALACFSTSISVSAIGAGDVDATPVNCGMGSGHFEGTLLDLEATPAAGQNFTGWTGTVSSTSNPLALTVLSDNAIVANFCATTADGDGDLVADACDNCPSTGDADQTDTDGDGQGNPCDTDDDGDGLADIVETGTGTYNSPTDTGTSPLIADTDGDGDADGVEVSAGWDPNAASCNPSLTNLLLLQRHIVGYSALSASKLAVCDSDDDQVIGLPDLLNFQHVL